MSSLLAPTTPSFYAVYLLRSYPPAKPGTSASSSSIPKPSTKTYVGSTPSPRRRLRQHNGQLTAGAQRTRTGRPWEMELLVWGFGSKIAALQFEWAFQKPHLSRHLKEIEGQGKAIWPGKGKRGKQSPTNMVLVLRGLLRSEPFCHWGLRVTFLAEWAWKAWKRLDEEEDARRATKESNGASSSSQLRSEGRQTSRTLPPRHLSPAIRCDFTGPLGTRKPLVAYSAVEKECMGLKQIETTTSSASTKKGKGKGKAKEQPPLSPSRGANSTWHETLPIGATPRGMGVTWHELENEVPVVPAVVPTVEQGDGEEEVWPPRMAMDDADFTFLTLHRLRRFLTHHVLSPMDLVIPTNTISSSSRPRQLAHSIKCSCCDNPIDIRDYTSWTLCPSPYHRLTPRPIHEAEEERTVDGAVALGQEEQLERSHCASAFHLTCLSKRWLQEEGGKAKEKEILPLTGHCPTCSSARNGSHRRARDESSLGLWSDVVRSVYRRKEWLEAGQLDFDALGRVTSKARKRRRVQEDTAPASSGEDSSESESAAEEEEQEQGQEEAMSSEGSREVLIVEKKVGRPKGSKNKRRDFQAVEPAAEAPAQPTKRVGRPPGSAESASPTEKAPAEKSRSPPPPSGTSLLNSLDNLFG
ncbi:hypothetical protein BDZ90DRAFT_234859 [Jaminaea rosea]|uniref:GIY-YIG domain-containing protein n=1 Tax=Jaminaea rosea TaxID=1569628 RepID=A0A316UJP8_9BASI|nr:hypothetical protein BDZ90DRAFT_234859 [Jaminaea rosea]PWN24581.1 hypothetical protein BDZ90DRAFT_234859 [Jaminaea rosea]